MFDFIEKMIGTPLEQMQPRQLLRYIVQYHELANDIYMVWPGTEGTAVMRTFQQTYGPERAAYILRHLFVENNGKLYSSHDLVIVTHHQFSKKYRWWTDAIDRRLQIERITSDEDALDLIFEA